MCKKRNGIFKKARENTLQSSDVLDLNGFAFAVQEVIATYNQKIQNTKDPQERHRYIQDRDIWKQRLIHNLQKLLDIEL